MQDGEQQSEAPGIMQTFAPEVIERREGWVKLRYPVRHEYTIGGGQLQGGIYAVMMDSAMAMACDRGLATASLQINLFRPVFTGQHVIVTGEVVRRGRRVIYAEAEVRDEEGRLVARGNQTGVPRDPAP